MKISIILMMVLSSVIAQNKYVQIGTECQKGSDAPCNQLGDDYCCLYTSYHEQDSNETTHEHYSCGLNQQHFGTRVNGKYEATEGKGYTFGSHCAFASILSAGVASVAIFNFL